MASKKTAPSSPSLEHWFRELSSRIFASAKRGEEIGITMQADVSDFVRFNGARIVQASHVEQRPMGISIRWGRKALGASLSVSANFEEAASKLAHELNRLRDWLPEAPEDPFLEPWAEPCVSRVEGVQSQQGAAAVESAVEEITSMGAGLDLVGLLSMGPLASAMATSTGHMHWHETHRCFFDFSVYAQGDRAIKDTVSGEHWDSSSFRTKLEQARQRLPLLFKTPKKIPPGHYKTLLSAEAMADVLGLSCWGGYSARAHLTGQSPFDALREGTKRLSPSVHLSDDLAAFDLPRVQEDGHVRQDRTELIRGGCYADWMCSPRTAREFSIRHNGSGGGETPSGMCLAPGQLSEAEAFKALDTGIYLSNVWYLNFSDRAAARITGMSRFASLWVENGEPVAPIAPMRFDDDLYGLLGDRLLALGEQAQRFDETSTYGTRSLGGIQAPLALVADMHFPL
jgi:predicted Zn-dependent protease